MEAIRLRVYLAGYRGWKAPRILRRVIARSELHRAWLLGSMGFFVENDISFGPANPYQPR